MDLHIYLYDETGRADQKLDSIIALLGALVARETIIMQELDDLTQQVQATDDAEQSAIALINGIAARIDAAGTDPKALKALTASLKSKTDELAAAVVANTPAADTPTADTPANG